MRVFGRPLSKETLRLAMRRVEDGGTGIWPSVSIDHRAARDAARSSAIAFASRALEDISAEGVLIDLLRVASAADMAPSNYCIPSSIPLGSSTASPDSVWSWESSSCSLDSAAYLCCLTGPLTSLTDAELRASLWLRYGLPCPDCHSCSSPCPAAYPTGDHQLGCGAFAGLRTARHDAMAMELFRSHAGPTHSQSS